MPIARTRRWASRHARFGVVILLSGVALLLSGCDAAPGTVDLNATPPRVFDLSFSPDSLDLASVDPSLIVGDSITIDVDVSVSAIDVDGDLASVAYTFLPPTRSDSPISNGELERVSGDTYSTTLRVILPVGQTGNYVLVVYAADNSGLLSNQVRGTVELAASEGFGSPPVVQSVVATPNPLIPPSTLRVVAEVTDEQGLSNILRVEVEIQDAVFGMSDDGETLGDAVAGDGLFTASFSVPVGVTPGDEEISVQAFDRNGNASEVVTIVLTIQ